MKVLNSDLPCSDDTHASQTRISTFPFQVRTRRELISTKLPEAQLVGRSLVIFIVDEGVFAAA